MPQTKTRLDVSIYGASVFFYMFASIGLRSLIGWGGFLAIGVVLISVGIWLFIKHKPQRFKWYRIPKPLIIFLLLALLSVAWSAYRLETLLGFAATLATAMLAVVIAAVLTWHEILRTMGTALRYLLGLSLLFELAVEIFVGKPILQGHIGQFADVKSKLLFWSRSLLFEGGPIQGIIANSALLGFLALLALIVFAVQTRGKLVRPVQGYFWIAVALLTLVLTRSATVTLTVGVVVITAIFALWTRRAGVHRARVYAVGAIGLGIVLVLGFLLQQTLSEFLGKGAGMNGRAEIWQKVADLAAEKPWFGWGWVSHWAPWAEPFASLDTKVGLPVMHAHNAWLDVRMQLGWIGLVIFVVLVLMTLQRVWCRAVDQPRRGVGAPLPYATSAMYPLLIMTALLVQSLTESRLLVEWGWLLLVIFAVKCRIDYVLPTKDSEPEVIPWSRVPIAAKYSAITG